VWKYSWDKKKRRVSRRFSISEAKRAGYSDVVEAIAGGLHGG
jgi:hypothetical protein